MQTAEQRPGGAGLSLTKYEDKTLEHEVTMEDSGQGLGSPIKTGSQVRGAPGGKENSGSPYHSTECSLPQILFCLLSTLQALLSFCLSFPDNPVPSLSLTTSRGHFVSGRSSVTNIFISFLV